MFELQSKLPGVPEFESWKFEIVTSSVPSVNVPLPTWPPSTLSWVQLALKSAQVGLPSLTGVGVTDAALTAPAVPASIATVRTPIAADRAEARGDNVGDRVGLHCESSF